ncbi:MAG: hypothetical protein QGI78_06545 [Phycisphaerales bacterium]|jgi:hypothetical protein|nr:hypothetical protein [Phycisphaerales bacterium]
MHNPVKHDLGWMSFSVIAVALVLFAVRYGSSIMDSGVVFDEQFITVPIFDLIEQGWSVQTAIDFEETKGPAMIWPYAAIGELFGGSLNALRLVSLLSSVACMAVLTFIASLCGVRRAGHLAVAVGWVLLPYVLVFSEIVMGEISFILFELLAVAVYLQSLRTNTRALLLPVLFCVLTAIALHSRIHVVALVGGICLVAFLRDGVRSWPWWVAGACAGLLRIPLLVRWDGLVSPKYQNLHALGFRLESLSYLAAALAPFVAVFAVQAWHVKRNKKWLVTAACLGVALLFIAPPTLVVPETIDYEHATDRFQGIIGTAVLMVTKDSTLQQLLLAALAAIGLAGLLGLRLQLHQYDQTIKSTALRITFWTLTIGWLLYACTQGFVFDRFLLVWAFLLPIFWWTQLPRYLFALQALAMFAIALRLAVVWL